MIEPLDLVDDENVALFQSGEQHGEIARLGDHGTPRGAGMDCEFAGGDLRERGLAAPPRTREDATETVGKDGASVDDQQAIGQPAAGFNYLPDAPNKAIVGR